MNKRNKKQKAILNYRQKVAEAINDLPVGYAPAVFCAFLDGFMVVDPAKHAKFLEKNFGWKITAWHMAEIVERHNEMQKKAVEQYKGGDNATHTS